ncbi:alpha/beta fold hydrolase [Tenacibaculum sp. SG-28]|uniref:alpha/beta fold hydrolase n=1 Tax=Tenacibaculum sp. SG-28 TaxID=754426 RepID=UPI000CF53368|nr:alpha/beta hydrolase [Tenacibaculum sp. SG-28]PQJ21892.1 alpha/beta hydrolase [Tenacibaculum sp. SG-28]
MIFTYKNSSVFYCDQGKGSAVVLLHGFLENSSMWNTIAPILARRNRVICIDLLGHGKTDTIGYLHTMEEMADMVSCVLKSLRIRRSFFIGHSMGGYVSLAFAKKFPENTKGLCLLNSTAQADTQTRKNQRLHANKIAVTNYISLVRASINNLFALSSKKIFSKEIIAITEDALQTSITGYIASNEGMRLRENTESVLQGISKRLIIAGEKDAVLSIESIQQEALRTNTKLVLLPNGHMSHIEDLEVLVKVLKSFIS